MKRGFCSATYQQVVVSFNGRELLRDERGGGIQEEAKERLGRLDSLLEAAVLGGGNTAW